LDILESLAKSASPWSGPPIIHLSLVKWASYLVRRPLFQATLLIQFEPSQVRLKVKLRGETLNEKNISIKDRFDLRAAAMNCFIDDPHLETYIQPFLDKIRKSLHTWYGTSLPVTSDPFKTANVLAALQAAPVPLPVLPPSAFQAAPVLLPALPPSAFQAAPVPLPIPTAALSAPEAKQGTKR
jgi:hypothetical protein